VENKLSIDNVSKNSLENNWWFSTSMLVYPRVYNIFWGT